MARARWTQASARKSATASSTLIPGPRRKNNSCAAAPKRTARTKARAASGTRPRSAGDARVSSHEWHNAARSARGTRQRTSTARTEASRTRKRRTRPVARVRRHGPRQPIPSPCADPGPGTRLTGDADAHRGALARCAGRPCLHAHRRHARARPLDTASHRARPNAHRSGDRHARGLCAPVLRADDRRLRAGPARRRRRAGGARGARRPHRGSARDPDHRRSRTHATQAHRPANAARVPRGRTADMAPEVTLIPRAESNTLRGQEESLRAYLADRLGIRTRIAPLPGARALLVSGPRPEHPKGLVIDDSLTAAERIYLYVHLAAHVALRHDVPVMPLVEPPGEPTSDAPVHRDAEA